MAKTMKKVLAAMLALAICLSILCIPASAVLSTSANNFPYMLCNYENEFVNIQNGEIVEGGMGGSGHALQLTTEKGSDYLLKNKWGSNFGATIPAGSTLRISFNVKLSEAVTSATFALICYQLGGYVADAKLSAPESTEWQKVTIEKTVEEESVMQAAFFRSGVTQTFLVDDFEAVIVPAEKADQIANLDGYYASYEGEVAPFAIYDSGYRNATTTERVVGDKTIQVVANPEGGGQVVKYTAAATVGAASTDLLISNSFSKGQYEGGKAPAGVVAPGETATMRFKYYLATAIDPSNNPGISVSMKDSNGVEYYFMGETIATTANEWHTATLSYTNDTEADITFGGKTTWMRLCKNYAAVSGSVKAVGFAEGEYGYREIYFDDMEMYITSAEEELPVLETLATSSDIAATGEIAAGKVVGFSHNFIPASTSAADVTDASVVRIVNYTTTGEKAVIDYCGINENIIFPATPADSEKMMLEIIPISSDGIVGKTVSYDIDSVPKAENITIKKTADGITVSTKEMLIAARLIFVTYSGQRMEAYDLATTVTLNADEDGEYPIPEGFEDAKVVLWSDLSTCIPLATAID